jgi:predicted  nucleic acid-binding Zn-ribbon protein
MKQEKINKCIKCGHSWKQRGKILPKKCPCCTNPNWNKFTNDDLMYLIFKTKK